MSIYADLLSLSCLWIVFELYCKSFLNERLCRNQVHQKCITNKTLSSVSMETYPGW